MATSHTQSEAVSVGETVLVRKKSAVRLRAMEGVVASRTVHARRISSTGGRPVALSGCQSFVQPQHPVRTMAGLVNLDGDPLGPAEVHRVEVVIFDPTDEAHELYSELIRPEKVLESTWHPWVEDTVGWNFRHDAPGVWFSLGGRSYLLSYFFYLHGVEGAFRLDNRVHVHAVSRRREW